MNLGVDVTKLDGFTKALREAPKTLLRELAKAYQNIGRYDIEQLRAKLPGELDIRSKGLAKSFKYKATDPSRADEFSKLFTSEYTGWKASAIFQTGGTITGKGKQLTILTDAARNPSGRRKYNQKQIRDLIASGKASIIPSPRGALVVQHIGGLTKTGKPRKGTRDVILAVLKKQVTERKRLDFYENAVAGEGMHQDFLLTAIENALVAIASGDAK